MKKAKVIYKQGMLTPNGREKKMELRLGAKGTGRLIQSVIYWSWSNASCDQADRIIVSGAKNFGLSLDNVDWGEEG